MRSLSLIRCQSAARARRAPLMLPDLGIRATFSPLWVVVPVISRGFAGVLPGAVRAAPR
jgi:hypothetical protein